MENRDDTLNNKSNSFSSPPNDLLTFVSHPSNSGTSNSLNSINPVSPKPQNINDMPVTSISDFSNQGNTQPSGPVYNGKVINLIDGLDGSTSQNNPIPTSNSTNSESESGNKFINLNFVDNSYNNNNNASYVNPFQTSNNNINSNPYGIQSVVQGTIEQSNRTIPSNDNKIGSQFVFKGFEQTNNYQSVVTGPTFGPKNGFSQPTTMNDNAESVLPLVSNQMDLNNTVQGNSDEVAMNVQKLMQETLIPKIELEKKTKKENKLFFGLSLASGGVFVLILLFAIFGKVDIFNFSIQEVYYENKNVNINDSYTTAVVTDNKWKVEFDSKKDERQQAIDYIKKDSQNQKDKCTNESVKKIEKEIEEKYGIVAVNFCELDYKFANEILNMIKTVYKEFPIIDSELTNLTLQNMKDENGYDIDSVLASFKSASLFARSTSFTGYPQVYKMSILLNARLFLDPSLGERVRILAGSGHFSSGATRTSIVAHEFGHYLSFLAQLKNSDMDKLILITRKNFRSYSKLINESDEGVFSKKILNEALENAKKKGYNFYDLYDFRSSISGYAAAYDMDGNPLYDETIAEAFHDYYLNRSKAKPASLEIMEVLKRYLKN